MPTGNAAPIDAVPGRKYAAERDEGRLRVRAHEPTPDSLSFQPALSHGRSLLQPQQNRELFWRMKFRSQKAMRSASWKWLSIEGREFLFDLSRDARERASLAARQPGTLAELRRRYAVWEASVPPIPDDARVSVIGGPADLARPS